MKKILVLLLLTLSLTIPTMAADLNGAQIAVPGIVKITATSSLNIECYKNTYNGWKRSWETVKNNNARYDVVITYAETGEEFKTYSNLKPNETIEDLDSSIAYHVKVMQSSYKKPSEVIEGSTKETTFNYFTVNPNVGGSVNYID